MQRGRKAIILGAPSPEEVILLERCRVSTLNQTIKTEAYQVVYWQLAIMAGLALIWCFLQGMQSGFSVFLGGLAYCLPNLAFVWRVFARTSVQAARQFLLIFVTGEVFKLFLSGVLFVLILRYLPIVLVPTLVGFVGAVIAFWIASFFLLTHLPEIKA